MKRKDLTGALILLIAGSILTLLAPYFLTKYSWIDLTQTGQIGDTIGGITSPITNIIAATLVFYALKAQIESNEETRKQFQRQEKDNVNQKELSYLIDQANIVRSEINSFGFSYRASKTEQTILYQGSSAFQLLIDRLPDLIIEAERQCADPFKFIPPLRTLELLLESISKYIDFVEQSRASKEDKEYFISAVLYQYNSKIRVAFDSTLETLRTSYTFDLPSGMQSESVFTDRLFNIVKEIDSKLK